MKDFEEMQMIFGNGDLNEGHRVMETLCSRIIHARTKHPIFAKNSEHGVDIVREECIELEDASALNNPEQVEYESYDVATTAIRVILREWEETQYVKNARAILAEWAISQPMCK